MNKKIKKVGETSTHEIYLHPTKGFRMVSKNKR